MGRELPENSVKAIQGTRAGPTVVRIAVAAIAKNEVPHEFLIDLARHAFRECREAHTQGITQTTPLPSGDGTILGVRWRKSIRRGRCVERCA